MERLVEMTQNVLSAGEPFFRLKPVTLSQPVLAPLGPKFGRAFAEGFALALRASKPTPAPVDDALARVARLMGQDPREVARFAGRRP